LLEIRVDISPDQLRKRTKAFGLRIVRLFRALPRNPEIIGKQLLRCGMSVGANYRATCRARSRQEFAAKLGIVVEEADEAIYWLEMLIEAGIVREKRLKDLLSQAHELTAIFTAAQYTSRRR